VSKASLLEDKINFKKLKEENIALNNSFYPESSFDQVV
jgi:hypothetical protein